MVLSSDFRYIVLGLEGMVLNLGSLPKKQFKNRIAMSQEGLITSNDRLTVNMKFDFLIKLR